MQTTIYQYAAGIMLALALNGCTSPQQTNTAHEVLNVITDVAQPSYDTFSALCTEAQWAIVRDQSRPAVGRKAAVAKLRTECHRVYALFELVIDLQGKARKIIDTAKTAADLAEAAGIVGELKETLTKAQAAAAALREKGSTP